MNIVGDFMNKKEILEEMKGKDFVLVGMSSLVVRGIFKKCDSIQFDTLSSFDVVDSIKCMKLEDCLSYFLELGDKAHYKKLKL